MLTTDIPEKRSADKLSYTERSTCSTIGYHSNSWASC